MEKRFLKRIFLARRYARDAEGALKTICVSFWVINHDLFGWLSDNGLQDMHVPIPVHFGRPSHS